LASLEIGPFLTAASCPRREFDTQTKHTPFPHPPPLKIATGVCTYTKMQAKSRPKKCPSKKFAKKQAKKGRPYFFIFKIDFLFPKLLSYFLKQQAVWYWYYAAINSN